MNSARLIFPYLFPLFIVMLAAFFGHYYFGEVALNPLFLFYSLNFILAVFPIVGLFRAIFIQKKGALSIYLISILFKAVMLVSFIFAKRQNDLSFSELSKTTFMIPFFLALVMEIFAFARFNTQALKTEKEKRQNDSKWKENNYKTNK